MKYILILLTLLLSSVNSYAFDLDDYTTDRLRFPKRISEERKSMQIDQEADFLKSYYKHQRLGNDNFQKYNWLCYKHHFQHKYEFITYDDDDESRLMLVQNCDDDITQNFNKDFNTHYTYIYQLYLTDANAADLRNYISSDAVVHAPVGSQGISTDDRIQVFRKKEIYWNIPTFYHPPRFNLIPHSTRCFLDNGQCYALIGSTIDDIRIFNDEDEYIGDKLPAHGSAGSLDNNNIVSGHTPLDNVLNELHQQDIENENKPVYISKQQAHDAHDPNKVINNFEDYAKKNNIHL